MEMAVLTLPRKFIVRCEKHLQENPRLADDVADFIARCGRLGLLYLEKVTTPDERAHCNPPNNNDRERPAGSRQYKGEKVNIYIPDRDFKRIEELAVNKLGITTTVTAWYILCVFNVLAGYWELPPKV
jgi:hypothetical protein